MGKCFIEVFEQNITRKKDLTIRLDHGIINGYNVNSKDLREIDNIAGRIIGSLDTLGSPKNCTIHVYPNQKHYSSIIGVAQYLQSRLNNKEIITKGVRKSRTYSIREHSRTR